MPLSFAQQRLWLIDQIDQGSTHYLLSGALKLTGVLDRVALQKSLMTIVDRHESLRTVFIANIEGEPEQQVRGLQDFDVPQHDLRQLDPVEKDLKLKDIFATDASKDFDLSHDLLLRSKVMQVEDNVHILLVTMHHIASDGWSMSLLINELGTLYNAYSKGLDNPLEPLAIQYADYALWQHRELQGKFLAEKLDYWKEKLAGLAPLNLPLFLFTFK